MKRARPLLGTFVEIEAQGLPAATLSRAIDEAFDAVARVQRLMSFHDPVSDLSALNRRAFAEPVAIDPWTYAVLKRALMLFRMTDGLFDCAVGAELMNWNFLPDHGSAGYKPGSLAAVHLLPDGRVRFDAPIALDLGGIAKGFAVDCAIAVLRRNGVKSAVVNAGGDLRVMGNAAHAIHVRDPLDPAIVRPAGHLRNGACATSSAAATRKTINGVAVSALLTGGRRRAIVSPHSYSVIARTCVVADALTKVLAQTGRGDMPCFARLGAVAFVIAPIADEAA